MSFCGSVFFCTQFKAQWGIPPSIVYLASKGFFIVFSNQGDRNFALNCYLIIVLVTIGGSVLRQRFYSFLGSLLTRFKWFWASMITPLLRKLLTLSWMWLSTATYPNTSWSQMMVKIFVLCCRIHDHPQYNGFHVDYDFSLLRLSRALDFSQYDHILPVCLPQSSPTPNGAEVNLWYSDTLYALMFFRLKWRYCFRGKGRE